MSDELLPCPFCGSPAEIERGSDHHGGWFNLGCSRHWGRVPDPDKACPGGRLFYTETEKSEAEAIAAWNTRTPASDGRAEGLREAAEIAKRFSATCAHEIFARANILARAAEREGGSHE